MAEWLGIYCRGLAMGSADLVPGVSGGTIALITGIYTRLLTALTQANVDTLGCLLKGEFARCWRRIDGNFLLVLGAGIASAILGLAEAIQFLLQHYPLLLWSFFFGLVLASGGMLMLTELRLEKQDSVAAHGFLVMLGGLIAGLIGLSPQASMVDVPGSFFLAGMLAITAMPDKAMDAGFDKDMILRFDEAIGGRYSIWSVVGFGLMLAIGPSGFRAMLAGGHAVDEHILSVPNHQNTPLNMALMRYWNTTMLGHTTESLCPYDQRLARFSAWVQQLEMESNGKSVNAMGDPVNGHTAPIVFGEPGSNAQHSYFQHLHQSPIITPITFMAPLRPLMADANMAADLVADHHDALVIQMLAQADTLALGSHAQDDKDATFLGGRPSSLITWLQVSPYTLGRLFALFEYVTTMSGSLWGLNSFDQPGVELGKKRARTYQDIYNMDGESKNMGTSSRHIFKQLQDLRSGPQIKS